MNYSFPIFFLFMLLGANACQLRENEITFTKDDTFSEVSFGKSSSPCASTRLVTSPDESQTVTTFLNGMITRWSVETGQPLTQWETRHFGAAHDLLILPGSKKILLANNDGVRLHKLDNGQTLAEFDDSFAIRNLAYYSLAVSQDGRIAVSAGIDGWPHHIPDPSGIGFSSEENSDAKKIQKQKILLMDLEKEEELGYLSTEDSFIRSLSISNDKKILTTISYLKISFFNIQNPLNIKLIKSIAVSDLSPSTGINPTIFFAANISKDMRLAAVSTEIGLYIVNLESQSIESKLSWPNSTGFALIRFLSWSEDNKTILGSNLQGIVTSWSLTTSRLQFKNHYQLSNQSNGTIFASSGSANPYAAILIDRHMRFAVVQGFIEDSSFGSCPGFRIIALK